MSALLLIIWTGGITDGGRPCYSTTRSPNGAHCGGGSHLPAFTKNQANTPSLEAPPLSPDICLLQEVGRRLKKFTMPIGGQPGCSSQPPLSFPYPGGEDCCCCFSFRRASWKGVCGHSVGRFSGHHHLPSAFLLSCKGF